jgi:uncharacterized integral membrane protein (TIGR00697 family)
VDSHLERTSYRYFSVVTAVFVTCLIISNIIAVKLVNVLGLVLPAGVIVFPISYIFGDILTEVYGYARSRQVIWIGFGCNLLAVIFIYLGGLLPAAGFWTGQEAYQTILGFAPRLLAASFVAYVFGEFLNSFVLAKLKVATNGRWLWMRTISSTLVGEGADSLVFTSLAFFGAMPTGQLPQLIVTQWLFKCGYEAVATPFTYLAVDFLKRAEKEDYYDRNTDFNPFRLRVQDN